MRKTTIIMLIIAIAPLPARSLAGGKLPSKKAAIWQPF
jgi:hypothetical protein